MKHSITFSKMKLNYFSDITKYGNLIKYKVEINSFSALSLKPSGFGVESFTNLGFQQEEANKGYCRVLNIFCS